MTVGLLQHNAANLSVGNSIDEKLSILRNLDDRVLNNSWSLVEKRQRIKQRGSGCLYVIGDRLEQRVRLRVRRKRYICINPTEAETSPGARRLCSRSRQRCRSPCNRIVAFHEARCVAVTSIELSEFFVGGSQRGTRPFDL